MKQSDYYSLISILTNRKNMTIKNIAFIDWQNLHLWLKSEWRHVDHHKLRVFLKDKFHVHEAYYFLWCVDDEYDDLYISIQKAGFILSFREHNTALLWKKKGNVDVDIVFSMMKKLIDEPGDSWNKIILVSGDWDYKKVVDYLIKKERFDKIIFPTLKHSSLYKSISNKHYYYLKDARKKIEHKKKT